MQGNGLQTRMSGFGSSSSPMPRSPTSRKTWGEPGLPVKDMEIWNANSDGFSFVISYESGSGPGFHGRTGFLASWRPIRQNRCAIKIGGSPFKTRAEAEEACEAMLGHLSLDGMTSQPVVEFISALTRRRHIPSSGACPVRTHQPSDGVCFWP